MVVDLDETDFGYSLGEVEILTELDNVDHASTQIENFLQESGLKSSDVVNSKIEVYMAQQNPELHTMLLKAGVFPPLSKASGE